MAPHAWRSIHRIFGLLMILLLAACSRPYTAQPTDILPTLGGPAMLLSPTAGAAPATANPAGATAAPAPAGGSSVGFFSFHMADVQHGWATGTGQVLYTSNGGQSWASVGPSAIPKDSTLQVFVIGAQSAWALVPIDLQHGTLYRTNDAGKTWQTAAVPFGGGYAQALNANSAFFMADRGAAAGSQAVDIYQTADGGATWTLVSHVDAQSPANQGLLFGGSKNGITFINPTNGWLTGFIPTDGATYIYVTQDGGKTWGQVQLALPAGVEKTQIDIAPPVFHGEQDGLLYLRVSQGDGILVFYATHDGGQTWNPLQLVNYSGLVSIPTAKNVIVWDGGTLHASQDGGKTWKDVTPNINLAQKIAGMQFVDGNTGWALGVEGKTLRLYHTNDGGSTWQ
jgi:photosystem II stability/assembly factor-like uncharacterized protein